MVKKVYWDSISRLFFIQPSRVWGIREIAREVKLSHPSVITYLKMLLKEGLILREARGYKSADSQEFKIAKRLATIRTAYESGLVRYLKSECSPNCVILFGSASRGEDAEKSDIDIFVEAKERSLALSRFEKSFERKINVTFGVVSRLNKDFLESVVNGTILYGGIRL